jgi:TonB family protein
LSIAASTLAMRRRPSGPALGKAPVPVTATVLSAVVHGALAVAIVVGGSAWAVRQPKTYVVNLVPAIAAVGAPQPPRPSLPPRPEEAPSPPRTTPSELPQREPTRSAPEMPARETPRESLGLPDRALPSRAPGLPQPSDKELPTVASAAPRTPAPPAPAVTTPRAAPAAPPPPVGRPTGSAQGSGAVTVNVSDFPFAWYLGAVQRKITERWAGKALQGHQPVAVFEIGRDGQVARLSIEKTSGNPYYDQAALRAISEATPFPPLPADFPDAVLRVHLGFNFAPDRG